MTDERVRYDPETVLRLAERGVRFVPLHRRNPANRNKLHPSAPRWQTRNWSVDDCLAPDVLGLGWMPAHSGLLVIDNDAEPDNSDATRLALQAALPPATYMRAPSQSEWRDHYIVRMPAWWIADKQISNSCEWREGVGRGEVLGLNCAVLPNAEALNAVERALALPHDPAVERWLQEQATSHRGSTKRIHEIVAEGDPDAAELRALSKGKRRTWLNQAVFGDPHNAERYMRIAAEVGLPIREVADTVARGIRDAKREGTYILSQRDWKIGKDPESLAFAYPYNVRFDETHWYMREPLSAWQRLTVPQFARKLAEWAWRLTQDTHFRDLPASAKKDEERTLGETGPAPLKLGGQHGDYRTFAKRISQRESRIVEAHEVNGAKGIVALPDGRIWEVASGNVRHWRESDGVILPIAVTPRKGDCSEWLDFFALKVPDAGEREWLRAFMLYCLVGDGGAQTFCFLHGPPGTGKSTIVDVLVAILGNTLAKPVGETDLLPSRGATPHSGWIVHIADTRLGYCTEVRSADVAWSPVLKQLVENKLVAARAMYGPHGEALTRAAIMVAANCEPYIPPGDGIVRRIGRLDITHKPLTVTAKELDIVNRLVAELPAIAHWILSSPARSDPVAAIRDAAMPETMRVKQRDMASDADPLATWLSHIVVKSEGSSVLVRAIRDRADMDEKAPDNASRLSTQQWNRSLRAVGFETRRATQADHSKEWVVVDAMLVFDQDIPF